MTGVPSFVVPGFGLGAALHFREQQMGTGVWGWKLGIRVFVFEIGIRVLVFEIGDLVTWHVLPTWIHSICCVSSTWLNYCGPHTKANGS